MTAPFRWGLLGAGDVARNFARSVLLLPDHQIEAVASRSAARAEALQADLGAGRAITGYETLVADPKVDAVYVATPSALHATHMALALEAGKPILCEKPFTVTAEEARQVRALAETTGTFCMEAMWMRFNPAIRALKARVDAGEIGEVRMILAELGMPVPYDPQSRYFDPALGGGALLDIGVYPVSLAWHLMGRPVAGTMMTSPAPTGVDAQSAITLSYEGGALASLTCSLDQRFRNTVLVAGTHGTLALDAPFYAPERVTFTKAPPPAPGSPDGGSGQGGLLQRLSQTHPRLIRLRRRYAPLLRQLFRRERSTSSYPVPGHGYQFEAAEVACCVRAGLKESPVMPLSETVEILEHLDVLRREGRFGDSG